MRAALVLILLATPAFALDENDTLLRRGLASADRSTCERGYIQIAQGGETTPPTDAETIARAACSTNPARRAR